jgi:hypothetical protein
MALLTAGGPATAMSAQGSLSQPGHGTVVVRCASEEGVSVGATRQLQVGLGAG